MDIDQLEVTIEETLSIEHQLPRSYGLVTSQTTGSHQDMDIDLLQQSINIIKNYLLASYHLGQNSHDISQAEFANSLKQLGIEAEQDMFITTDGTNTHKGLIYLLSLITSSLGRIENVVSEPSLNHICQQVSALATKIESLGRKTNTFGYQALKKYGIRGIVGQAKQGLPQARLASKLFDKAQAITPELIEQTLLYLMCQTNDTNILKRGTLQGLNWVKQQAQTIYFTSDQSIQKHQKINLNQAMLQKNLSPGGSADLLAVSYYLAQIKADYETN